MSSNYIETDVLIIGSGLAGGTAALNLAKKGYNITLVTRSFDSTDSNTYHAQGGIIYKNPNETIQTLSRDIINAGDGMCNIPAVEFLSEKGPGLVEKVLINELNIQFD
jgi:L-aspartate oxidase